MESHLLSPLRECLSLGHCRKQQCYLCPCILDLRPETSMMSGMKIIQSQPSINSQQHGQYLSPCWSRMNLKPVSVVLTVPKCSLCITLHPYSVCALGNSYSLITFLCPFQCSLQLKKIAFEHLSWCLLINM